MHKYQTSALNAAWGTHFWSHDYTSWAPDSPASGFKYASNPCLELDFYRFL